MALPGDYPEFLARLTLQVRRSWVRAARVVNTELLGLYWQFGTAILGRQQTQGWGAKVIDQLARDLRSVFP